MFTIVLIIPDGTIPAPWTPEEGQQALLHWRQQQEELAQLTEELAGCMTAEDVRQGFADAMHTELNTGLATNEAGDLEVMPGGKFHMSNYD